MSMRGQRGGGGGERRREMMASRKREVKERLRRGERKKLITPLPGSEHRDTPPPNLGSPAQTHPGRHSACSALVPSP